MLCILKEYQPGSTKYSVLDCWGNKIIFFIQGPVYHEKQSIEELVRRAFCGMGYGWNWLKGA